VLQATFFLEAIMNFRSIAITVTGILAFSPVAHASDAQKINPQVVLQRYVDAINAGDTDAALAIWSADGAMTNTRGRTTAGRENLRRFIQANIAGKQRLDPESVQTVGDKVTWNNRESNDSYKKLGVAPVQITAELLIQDGMIKSWVAYFPPSEITRIEQACAIPEAQGVLLNNQPCSQFIEQAKAQTVRVLGSGAFNRR